MFTLIQSFVWDLWSGYAELFSPIPYGNPYFATAFLVFVVVSLGVCGYNFKKRHDLKLELGDQFERFELSNRIMNRG